MFLRWHFGAFGITINSFAHLKDGGLKRRSLIPAIAGRFKEVVLKIRLGGFVRMKYYFTCIGLAAVSLFAEPNVLALAGSTRADSTNKKLVNEAAAIMREMGANVTVVDLKDFLMPIFDWDLEQKEGYPQNAKKLRDLFLSNDAVIISTPEYNASMPAVLKNAIDWLSRSEDGHCSYEAFEGKTFAIMSSSGGKAGGANVLSHLRDTLEEVHGKVIEKQVTLSRPSKLFNQEGKLTSEPMRKDLKEEIALLKNIMDRSLTKAEPSNN
jgi:chromate reductase